MKSKRLIAAIIAVVMLIAVMPVSAFASRTPSNWAKSEMDNANTAGILTANAAKNFICWLHDFFSFFIDECSRTFFFNFEPQILLSFIFV